MKSYVIPTVEQKPDNIILHTGTEIYVRNICFIDNKHISTRFHCNRSGLHLNYYGTKKLQENFLYEVVKLYWQFEKVGMYTLSKESIRVTN